MSGTLLIVGIAWLLLFFIVAAQVARARIDDTAKAVWMLAVMLVPLFGALGWWMVGKPVKNQRPTFTGSMK
ncbi:PLD nuclease N-terminal domain-containing protein [Agromyces sp. NPDC057679]|uniref:PLD nuclease N-terminal domain-containing protein n=1 Tax=Agromyces sp. NPDC057679 TaxID=3346207 RepID=UPI00366D7DBA